jgi:hypothetical protein
MRRWRPRGKPTRLAPVFIAAASSKIARAQDAAPRLGPETAVGWAMGLSQTEQTAFGDSKRFG